jgi:two-component system response regulator AlgR
MTSVLRALIVDDEALARSRMRALLADCRSPAVEVVAEADNGERAWKQIASRRPDLVLLDIHMPILDGLALARRLRGQPGAPAVVFVTTYAAHAVTAFELEAVDYLMKPVRAERLRQALRKVARHLDDRRPPSREALLVQDRGGTERVPLAEVIYLKSEFKYLTVRTARRSHLFNGSLADLEARYPGRFLRVHRNALVARAAIRALERHGGEDWALRLDGIPEPVIVSRRQLPMVREMLKGP